MSSRPRSSSPGAAASGTWRSSVPSTPSRRTGTGRCRYNPRPKSEVLNLKSRVFPGEDLMRARIALAASFAAAALLAVELIAQTTTAPPAQGTAPPMTSVLAGKRLTPPIRGEAALEWVDPKPEKKGDMVITKMTVRNASAAPIARLTINETWYNKAGANVTAGRGVVNGLLQPGEVAVVEIQTPWKEGMSGFQRQYAHANGTI